MSVVFIESPYSGDIDRNMRYLALCMADAALLFDECPYASHGLMTQHPRAKATFVSDYDAKWNVVTRDGAIEMSHRIRHRSDRTVFYVDRGWSRGMLAAKEYCEANNLPYSVRALKIDELSYAIPFCSKEFCHAIIDDKPYEHYLE